MKLEYICDECGREIPLSEYEEQCDIFCPECGGHVEENTVKIWCILDKNGQMTGPFYEKGLRKAFTKMEINEQTVIHNLLSSEQKSLSRWEPLKAVSNPVTPKIDKHQFTSSVVGTKNSRERERNMFCPKCGSQIETEAAFCGSCGTGIAVSGAKPFQQESHKSCKFCKEKIHIEAIKCKHCGAMLNQFDATGASDQKNGYIVTPESNDNNGNGNGNGNGKNDKLTEIRQILKKYEELKEVACLECGYSGLMGIMKIKVPWYFTWWVLIPIMLTGIGTIPAIVLGLCRGASQKYTVECPSCKEILTTK